MTTAERINYVRVQVLALICELYEALDEVSWKTWTVGEPRFDERKFGQELVDAQHFLLNLFLVAGWEPHEVFTHFMAKNEVNRKRHESRSYDGVSTKCANPDCRRALDEPGGKAPLTVTRADHADLAWCDDGCYDAWWDVTNLGGDVDG